MLLFSKQPNNFGVKSCKAQNVTDTHTHTQSKITNMNSYNLRVLSLILCIHSCLQDTEVLFKDS